MYLYKTLNVSKIYNSLSMAVQCRLKSNSNKYPMPWECSSNCQTTSIFIYIATPLDPNANCHEVTGQLRHFSCHEMGEIVPGWGEIKSKHSGTWRGAVNLMRFSKIKIKVKADCWKKWIVILQGFWNVVFHIKIKKTDKIISIKRKAFIFLDLA